MLAARLDDTTLSRLVFADLLADLHALAAAATAGDAEEVYRKLNRLDRALADIAERAARFYHMLGDLGRTTDHRAEVFLAHKDALLAHLRDFHDELQRYSPRLREARLAVEATGLERLVEPAAEADERLFRTPAERLDDWRRRWSGLRAWLGAAGAAQGGRPAAEATIAAIGDVLALLRRVTEARRGGVSRESQLRHLAAWFAGCPSEDAAHALFDAVFGLRRPAARRRRPRRPGGDRDPPLLVGGARGGAVAHAGGDRARAGPGPARGGRPRRRGRGGACASSSWPRPARSATPRGRSPPTGCTDACWPSARRRCCCVLLDLALAARAPLRAAVRAAGSAHGVRLQLRPCAGTSTVQTVRGTLHLDGVRLTVTPLAGPPAGAPADLQAGERVGAGR